MKWPPGDNNKKGTGTTGLVNNIKKKHPTQSKEAMELIGTREERNAPVATAIGEESRDDKKTAKLKHKKQKKHLKNITCEHFNILKMNEMKNEK